MNVFYQVVIHRVMDGCVPLERDPQSEEDGGRHQNGSERVEEFRKQVNVKIGDHIKTIPEAFQNGSP